MSPWVYRGDVRISRVDGKALSLGGYVVEPLEDPAVLQDRLATALALVDAMARICSQGPDEPPLRAVERVVEENRQLRRQGGLQEEDPFVIYEAVVDPTTLRLIRSFKPKSSP